MNFRLLSLPAIGLLTLLTGCSGLPSLQKKEAEVVFALGTRDGYTSPMNAALKPASTALEFQELQFDLNGAHRKALSELAAAWPETKPRYLIAGYAPPELPEDYARSLSERRAQAVRQYLIEHGVEAANLQTVGFGSDSSPSGPATGVVVIYHQ